MTNPDIIRKTTIRSSVKENVAEKIPELISSALTWMRERYPDVDFDNARFIFSSRYSRSRYFPNTGANAKYPYPVVCISTRARLLLYDKRSLGIKNHDVFVGSSVQMMCALIHELTHHVQWQRGARKGNELDTTMNEMEYLSEFHPNHHKKIITEKSKSK